MLDINEPTTEQCNNHELVYKDQTRRAYAAWYPQMGGYVAKCVAVFDLQWKDLGHGRHGGCIDVYVWHDGDFPFEGRAPIVMHHCNPKQFIRFGEWLKEINESGKHREGVS